MQIKQIMSDWANRWFFVKDKKAALTIALVSVGVGLAVDIGLVIFRRTHDEFFLNRYGPVVDNAVRFTACISVCFILFFILSGLYNLWKRCAKKKLEDKTEI